jgi:predicted P-loop ATPase
MDNSVFIDALAPILTRVAPESCWIKKDGQAPKHIKSGLTRARLLQHFGNGPYFGAAPMSPGSSTTQIALLDIDDHDGSVGWEGIVRSVSLLFEHARTRGLHAIPFRSSGGSGAHIYFIWNGTQDGYSVRQLLISTLQHCGYASGSKGLASGEIEIFPKQDVVPEDGWGNMFILPLAKASLPLDPLEFDPLDRETVLTMAWPVSDPVPVVEREIIQRNTDIVDTCLDDLRAALNAIPNTGDSELSYDDWRNVIFGLHNATGGSDDGLALAHEFSAKSGKYDADFLESRVWPYIKEDHGTERGAITANTIFAMAREYGFVEDVSAKFDIIEAPATEDTIELPKFERRKDGAILANISNLAYALSDPNVCAMRIRYDEFKDEVMLARQGTEEWRAIRDKDITDMRIYLERNGFLSLGKEMTRDVFGSVAEENSFDSAIFWLENLPKWDGKPRVAKFLTRYFKTEDTPYADAVSRYIWTALAGRVMEPGVKCDMAPILVGEQGSGKTDGIKAMVPSEEFYGELDLSDKDDDLARVMRGKLVCELEELRGMSSREQKGIKAFITRTHEEWVPKFKEFATKYPRRCLLIGSTNEEENLDDETGARRYLPIKVGPTDLAALRADRDQLWAEGLAMFRKKGVMWQDAMRLARNEHAAFTVRDAWEESVQCWLEECDLDEMTPRGEIYFTTRSVLTGALGFEMRHVRRSEDMRMNKLLVKMGYTRKSKRTPEGPRWVWGKD